MDSGDTLFSGYVTLETVGQPEALERQWYTSIPIQRIQQRWKHTDRTDFRCSLHQRLRQLFSELEKKEKKKRKA